MELPVPVGDIELEVEAASTIARARAWTRLEVGASPASLNTVAIFPDKENPPGPLSTQGSKWKPTEAARQKLAKDLAGATVLYVRVSAGGTPVGEDCGYACVLRSHGLPDHLPPDGRLLWSPALRLRVRAP